MKWLKLKMKFSDEPCIYKFIYVATAASKSLFINCPPISPTRNAVVYKFT